jgi:capsular polysaccharide transport system permease protein
MSMIFPATRIIRALLPRPGSSRGSRMRGESLPAPDQAKGRRWIGSPALQRIASARFRRLSFAVLVLLPTVLAGFYFGFIASDQFVAELRLAVRAPQAPKTEDSAMAAIKTLFQRSGSMIGEAFIVSNYIRSRNILQEIDSDGWVRRIFSRPEIDFLSRFDSTESEEQLWKYWRGKVIPSVDTLSDILTVRIAAFRREDALALAERVMRSAEALVNDYSTRMRADALRTAQREIDAASERYRSALLKLRDFRDADRVVDPIVAATATAQLLLETRLQRIMLERERTVTVGFTSPQSPAAQLLGDRVNALDLQIAKLQAQLTAEHENVKAASETLAKFEELQLARMFAQELLSITLKAYEAARARAEFQQAYLTVFVAPAIPEQPQYPRRFVNTLLVFLISMVAWGTLTLVAASARDQTM